MTPLVFVSFLVSLALVDFRYSVRRSHYHAEGQGRLPRWLHRLLFRYQRYQYVAVDEGGRPRGETPGYYHSKQRKLVKMEAADAFELRSTVLAIMGVLSLGLVWGLVWGLWRLLSWGWSLCELGSRQGTLST